MPAGDKPTHPALRRNGTGITADGEFHMPTRALFGRGIAVQAAEHVGALGAASVLLVTDPGVLAAGLVDYLHVVQVPIVLGRGVRLWDGLEGLQERYSIETVTVPSGATHLFFTR